MFTRLRLNVFLFALMALLAVSGARSAVAQPLDPNTIPKYMTPLFIPPAMPLTGNIPDPGGSIHYYEIAVQQFQQQVLPAGFPQTTVWSYGSVNHPSSFHYPARTIEAVVNKRVRVKWINNLKDQGTGNFLPHLLPVDQKIHWANPPGTGCVSGDPNRTDCTTDRDGSYTGPVPLVTHLHGSHVDPESDGFPEAWYMPAANNIDCKDAQGYPQTPGTDDDFFCRGSNFGQVAGAPLEDGAAYFQYRNDQRATTLWYHPHDLGMARLNIYAGPAGFYILRRGPSDLPAGVLPGPAPRRGDPPGMKYYEIPIVIQDRTFNEDGSLFYSPVGTEVHEKFFGDTIVVNGNTWPYLNVEPRRYRLRFLNASNSRFLTLKMVRGNPSGRSFRSFWQVGADGGFLPAPVQLHELTIAPAERADIVIDFTGVAVGANVYLINSGDNSDPATTGQVMKFIVTPLTSSDMSLPVQQLTLPAIAPLGPPVYIRQVSLNGDALLGVVDPLTGAGVPMLWSDPITENPVLNTTEVWVIHNFSDDDHPIHPHQVQFEIVNREDMRTGVVRGPEPGETGTKDTVIAHGGEITRIKAKFDIPGLYVWHCHILEHEDDEMMRSYCVGDPANCQP